MCAQSGELPAGHLIHRSVLTRLCCAKSFAPCRGYGGFGPMWTAVLQPQSTCHASPRSAFPANRCPSFAPENNGCFSRVTHTRPPARARAVNDRTDMTAGASWSLPLAGGSCTRTLRIRAHERGFLAALVFQFLFFRHNTGAPLRGQLPPARRARGGIYGCCGGAASDLRAAKCARIDH